MDVLTTCPHLTAAQVAGAVDGLLPKTLSRQGLYNVLDDLTRAGLVRCIEPAGSVARYEMRVGDNHHHLVCRSCGCVEDVDCSVGEAPCLQPVSAPEGFQLDEAEVTWWGTCRSCSPVSVPTEDRPTEEIS